jgi:fatty acid CoA ligase FadD9
MPATPGAAVSARRFHDSVRELGVGPDNDIPHRSRDLMRKYVDDLKAVRLV